MWSNVGVAVGLLLAVCTVGSADAVKVIRERPRIWVLAEDIPRIRERCRGPHKAEFEKIRAGGNGYLEGTYEPRGPGKGLWVDGKNYPPKGKDKKQGAWRVEVTQEGRTRYEFLHVLRAGGGAPAAVELTPAGLDCRTTDDAFTFTIPADGRSVTVSLSRQWRPGDPIAGHVIVTGRRKAFVDRDFTQEVAPEARYVHRKQ